MRLKDCVVGQRVVVYERDLRLKGSITRTDLYSMVEVKLDDEVYSLYYPQALRKLKPKAKPKMYRVCPEEHCSCSVNQIVKFCREDRGCILVKETKK